MTRNNGRDGLAEPAGCGRVMVRRVMVVAALAGLVSPVRAQQRASSIRTAAVVLDLGFQSTEGNANASTLSIGERVNLRTGDDRIRFAQRFDFARSESQGQVNLERYGGEVRLDYRVARNVFALAAVGWDRDTRAGIRSRWGETVGLALEYRIANADILGAEAGITALQQRDLVRDPGGLDGRTIGGHLAGRYRHIFSRDTYFGQWLRLAPNFTVGSGYRIVTESEANARVSSVVSLKLRYLIEYNHRPSLVPGSTSGERFQTTDRLFLAGLSFSF